jgi:N-acetylmuramoyl-L-alanine amidase
MRNINEIILHCSATKEGQHFDASDIDEWHKARGWKGIGYHFVIKIDGTIESGRPVEHAGAHAKGRNRNSIGICYIGGLDENGKPKDTRTPAQRRALMRLLSVLQSDFGPIPVIGHNEISNKACPSFDVQRDLEYPGGRAAKPLSKSRTMAGAGLAGVGTIVSEIADQIEPLTHYADTLKWAFLGLTVVGIGLVAYARWDDARKAVK